MSETTPEEVAATNDDELTTEVQDNSIVTDIATGEVMTEEDPTVAPAEPYKPRIAEKVSLGRIVEYRSRTGNYSVPAVINCTTNSIYQPGVEAGFVPPISQIDNVHLTVFSPGRPGLRTSAGEDAPVAGAENFVNPSPYPISENVSGCYQEWDIPYDINGGAGTWRWPERV